MTDPNKPFHACVHALITLGRAFNAEMDTDRDDYALKCAKATLVLAKAHPPDLAMAIEKLAKRDALFIADAIQILAKIKTRAEALGPAPFGTA
jgi:hypothetical protein